MFVFLADGLKNLNINYTSKGHQPPQLIHDKQSTNLESLDVTNTLNSEHMFFFGGLGLELDNMVYLILLYQLLSIVPIHRDREI